MRTRSKRAVAAFVAGSIFGVGLLVSGMTRPDKVRAFLDFTGDWDASLAFVMGGAIAVHGAFLRFWRGPGARPAFADGVDVPTRRGVDANLLGGAALFGVGWGMSGYCPGPALVSLASGSVRAIVFVAAMALGMVLVRLRARAAPAPDAVRGRVPVADR